MVANEEKPLLAFPDAAAWEAWLETEHERSPGVRLVIAKKGRNGLHVGDALDVALCFGWIDGTRYSNDADTFVQSYGPRRPGSVWSQVNREHIERLDAAGRMRPRGLAEVERAKADGRWDAAYRIKGGELPAELAAALAASPEATAFWATLRKSEQWSFIFRVQTAKLAATRERKAAEYAAMLARGERLG